MQRIAESDSKNLESNDVVLHRYHDFDGKEYALGKQYVPGHDYIEKFWYLGVDMKRHYLHPDDLVEVKRDDKRGTKPQTIYFAHCKNRKILRYTATLDIAGKDLSVKGFCLTEKHAETIARRRLARKSGLSFHAVNSWIKIHPSTLQVKTELNSLD